MKQFVVKIRKLSAENSRVKKLIRSRSSQHLTSCFVSVYKDLLAITSTSTMVNLTVRFEKQPKENSFNEFLSKTLKFQQLTDDEVPSSVSFEQ